MSPICVVTSGGIGIVGREPRSIASGGSALRGFHEDVDTFTVTPTVASGNLFDFVLDAPLVGGFLKRRSCHAGGGRRFPRP